MLKTLELLSVDGLVDDGVASCALLLVHFRGMHNSL